MPAFKPPTSRLDRCLRLGGGSASWHRANVLCHAGPESTGSRRLLWQSMCTACVRCVVATLVRGGPHNHAAAAATCRHTGGASKVDSLPPHHSWITPTYYPGRLPVFCVKLRIIVVELRVIRIAAAVHEWCACKPSTTRIRCSLLRSLVYHWAQPRPFPCVLWKRRLLKHKSSLDRPHGLLQASGEQLHERRRTDAVMPPPNFS